MKNGKEHPWSDGGGIWCCKDCVAPKRHPGCHSTCKEYKDEKAKDEKKKEKIRADNSHKITAFEFEEINYSRSKRYKPKR